MESARLVCIVPLLTSQYSLPQESLTVSLAKHIQSWPGTWSFLLKINKTHRENLIKKTILVCKVAMTIAAGLLFSTVSQAQIVSADWKTAGDNLITRDTTSGLDWLDLTETTSMGYVNVLADSTFAGWRSASVTEVATLWSHFGTGVDLSSPSTTQAVGFIDPNVTIAAGFLGNTYAVLAGYTGSKGNTANTGVNAGFQVTMSAYITPTGNTVYERADFGPAGQSAGTIGTYLVQTSPVPVPAAVWLLGSGLLGMIGIAKRRREI